MRLLFPGNPTRTNVRFALDFQMEVVGDIIDVGKGQTCATVRNISHRAHCRRVIEADIDNSGQAIARPSNVYPLVRTHISAFFFLKPSGPTELVASRIGTMAMRRCAPDFDHDRPAIGDIA
jgi:hypothetical protein